jgi:tryptophan halogenase
MISLYNRFIAESWDEIRDFIALHYKLNTRLQTPFWEMCRAETDLGNAEPLVEFYKENGPTALHQNLLLRATSTFRIEGYIAMLVGQAVPCCRPYQPTAAEKATWKRHQQECATAAQRGLTVREALDFVRSPEVSWG